MFDDRLQEIIMQEMMESFGQDVRTDEGSLAWNACVKIAEKLEEVYGDMDQINDNLLPDTQDIFHLIRYAKERGIEYNYATYPVVKGVFTQEIELGQEFTCGDYIYTVTNNIDGYNYEMECTTEGTEANGTIGELTPIDYIDDFAGGTITEILIPGVDDEDEEAFRKRVIDSFESKAFGGNKAEYRQVVNKIAGVGGCKPCRRSNDSPWVNITVIANDFSIPTESLIFDIQSAIDPEENHGAGDGIAPICHSVKIYAVGKTEINISVNVTFDSGYSVETSKSQIESAIDDYLLTCRKSWEDNEFSDMTVRISHIEAKILSVDGVLDVSNTKINGVAENKIVAWNNVPILGGVTIV